MLVVDLETIPIDNPELVIGEELYNKYRPKSKKDENLNLDALDVDFGQIACIGLVSFDNLKIIESKIIFPELDGLFFEDNIEREKHILQLFWEFVEKKESMFHTISFNGLNFDLPFLIRRSMFHGIVPNISKDLLILRKYYPEPHFDILQALTFWGSIKFKSLDFYGKLFNLKTKETCKSTEIYDLWKNKEYEKIAEHCKEDCNLTYQLFKKIYKFYKVNII